MYYDANYNGNKVEVCKVGDLKPGDRFRDPDGHDFMVAEGHLIVRLDNGTVQFLPDRPRSRATLDWTGSGYRKDTRLGRDRRGRLYASRYLNPSVQSDTYDDRQAMILLQEEDVDDLDLNQASF